MELDKKKLMKTLNEIDRKEDLWIAVSNKENNLSNTYSIEYIHSSLKSLKLKIKDLNTIIVFLPKEDFQSTDAKNLLDKLKKMLKSESEGDALERNTLELRALERARIILPFFDIRDEIFDVFRIESGYIAFHNRTKIFRLSEKEFCHSLDKYMAKILPDEERRNFNRTDYRFCPEPRREMIWVPPC